MGIAEADRGLDPAQFEAINERFYAGLAPSLYFEARLRLLMAAAANGWPTDFLEHGGFQWPALPDEGYFSAEAAKLVAIETLILFHHAAETAWLLFLAHENPQGCPRLAIARLRRDLAKQVRDYLDELDEDVRLERVRVAFGRDDGAVFEEPAEVDRLIGSTDTLLRELGKQLLHRGALYNAAKHGLAVDGKHAEISATVGDDFEISRAGLWLSHIEYRDTAEGSRWVESDTAIEPDRLMAMISATCGLLEGLWVSGRARFGEPLERVQVKALPPEEILRRALVEGRVLERLQRELIYLGADRRLWVEAYENPSPSLISREQRAGVPVSTFDSDAPGHVT